jgi:hypothetical protein
MALSLKHARLCLDCDWLTDQPACSQCGVHGTVPIAGWFKPLDERRGGSGRSERSSGSPRHRFILVVQHQRRELYRILRQALDGSGVEVLYERRVGQRRRVAAGPAADERRRTDRRRPRPSAVAYEITAGPVEPESLSQPGAGRVAANLGRPRRRQPASV